MSPEIQLYQATEVAENTHSSRGGENIEAIIPTSLWICIITAMVEHIMEKCQMQVIKQLSIPLKIKVS